MPDEQRLRPVSSREVAISARAPRTTLEGGWGGGARPGEARGGGWNGGKGKRVCVGVRVWVWKAKLAVS